MAEAFRTEASDDDLEDIGQFIARHNPERADSFVDEIIAIYDRLAEHPHMGRDRSELADGMRSFPCARYVIFYRVVDRGVEILRVLHGARDLPSLFEAPDC